LVYLYVLIVNSFNRIDNFKYGFGFVLRMSMISELKKNRIKEDILKILYDNFPKMMWTFEVAEEIIRDDEFCLKLLEDLKSKKLVNLTEESKGRKIKRGWSMHKNVYEEYKKLF